MRCCVDWFCLRLFYVTRYILPRCYVCWRCYDLRCWTLPVVTIWVVLRCYALRTLPLIYSPFTFVDLRLRYVTIPLFTLLLLLHLICLRLITLFVVVVYVGCYVYVYVWFVADSAGYVVPRSHVYDLVVTHTLVVRWFGRVHIYTQLHTVYHTVVTTHVCYTVVVTLRFYGWLRLVAVTLPRFTRLRSFVTILRYVTLLRLICCTYHVALLVGCVRLRLRSFALVVAVVYGRVYVLHHVCLRSRLRTRWLHTHAFTGLLFPFVYTRLFVTVCCPLRYVYVYVYVTLLVTFTHDFTLRYTFTRLHVYTLIWFGYRLLVTLYVVVGYTVGYRLRVWLVYVYVVTGYRTTHVTLPRWIPLLLLRLIDLLLRLIFVVIYSYLRCLRFVDLYVTDFPLPLLLVVDYTLLRCWLFVCYGLLRLRLLRLRITRYVTFVVGFALLRWLIPVVYVCCLICVCYVTVTLLLRCCCHTTIWFDSRLFTLVGYTTTHVLRFAVYVPVRLPRCWRSFTFVAFDLRCYGYVWFDLITHVYVGFTGYVWLVTRLVYVPDYTVDLRLRLFTLRLHTTHVAPFTVGFTLHVDSHVYVVWFYVYTFTFTTLRYVTIYDFTRYVYVYVYRLLLRLVYGLRLPVTFGLVGVDMPVGSLPLRFVTLLLIYTHRLLPVVDPRCWFTTLLRCCVVIYVRYPTLLRFIYVDLLVTFVDVTLRSRLIWLRWFVCYVVALLLLLRLRLRCCCWLRWIYTFDLRLLRLRLRSPVGYGCLRFTDSPRFGLVWLRWFPLPVTHGYVRLLVTTRTTILFVTLQTRLPHYTRFVHIWPTFTHHTLHTTFVTFAAHVYTYHTHAHARYHVCWFGFVVTFTHGTFTTTRLHTFVVGCYIYVYHGGYVRLVVPTLLVDYVPVTVGYVYWLDSSYSWFTIGRLRYVGVCVVVVYSTHTLILHLRYVATFTVTLPVVTFTVTLFTLLRYPVCSVTPLRYVVTLLPTFTFIWTLFVTLILPARLFVAIYVVTVTALLLHHVPALRFPFVTFAHVPRLRLRCSRFTIGLIYVYNLFTILHVTFVVTLLRFTLFGYDYGVTLRLRCYVGDLPTIYPLLITLLIYICCYPLLRYVWFGALFTFTTLLPVTLLLVGVDYGWLLLRCWFDLTLLGPLLVIYTFVTLIYVPVCWFTLLRCCGYCWTFTVGLRCYVAVYVCYTFVTPSLPSICYVYVVDCWFDLLRLLLFRLPVVVTNVWFVGVTLPDVTLRYVVDLRFTLPLRTLLVYTVTFTFVTTHDFTFPFTHAFGWLHLRWLRCPTHPVYIGIRWFTRLLPHTFVVTRWLRFVTLPFAFTFTTLLLRFGWFPTFTHVHGYRLIRYTRLLFYTLLRCCYGWCPFWFGYTPRSDLRCWTRWLTLHFTLIWFVTFRCYSLRWLRLRSFTVRLPLPFCCTVTGYGYVPVTLVTTRLRLYVATTVAYDFTRLHVAVTLRGRLVGSHTFAVTLPFTFVGLPPLNRLLYTLHTRWLHVVHAVDLPLLRSTPRYGCVVALHTRSVTVGCVTVVVCYVWVPVPVVVTFTFGWLFTLLGWLRLRLRLVTFLYTFTVAFTFTVWLRAHGLHGFYVTTLFTFTFTICYVTFCSVGCRLLHVYTVVLRLFGWLRCGCYVYTTHLVGCYVDWDSHRSRLDLLDVLRSRLHIYRLLVPVCYVVVVPVVALFTFLRYVWLRLVTFTLRLRLRYGYVVTPHTYTTRYVGLRLRWIPRYGCGYGRSPRLLVWLISPVRSLHIYPVPGYHVVTFVHTVYRTFTRLLRCVGWLRLVVRYVTHGWVGCVYIYVPLRFWLPYVAVVYRLGYGYVRYIYDFVTRTLRCTLPHVVVTFPTTLRWFPVWTLLRWLLFYTRCSGRTFPLHYDLRLRFTLRLRWIYTLDFVTFGYVTPFTFYVCCCCCGYVYVVDSLFTFVVTFGYVTFGFCYVYTLLRFRSHVCTFDLRLFICYDVDFTFVVDSRFPFQFTRFTFRWFTFRTVTVYVDLLRFPVGFTFGYVPGCCWLRLVTGYTIYVPRLPVDWLRLPHLRLPPHGCLRICSLRVYTVTLYIYVVVDLRYGYGWITLRWFILVVTVVVTLDYTHVVDLHVYVTGSHTRSFTLLRLLFGCCPDTRLVTIHTFVVTHVGLHTFQFTFVVTLPLLHVPSYTRCYTLRCYTFVTFILLICCSPVVTVYVWFTFVTVGYGYVVDLRLPVTRLRSGWTICCLHHVCRTARLILFDSALIPTTHVCWFDLFGWLLLHIRTLLIFCWFPLLLRFILRYDVTLLLITVVVVVIWLLRYVVVYVTIYRCGVTLRSYVYSTRCWTFVVTIWRCSVLRCYGCYVTLIWLDLRCCCLICYGDFVDPLIYGCDSPRYRFVDLRWLRWLLILRLLRLLLSLVLLPRLRLPLICWLLRYVDSVTPRCWFPVTDVPTFAIYVVDLLLLRCCCLRWIYVDYYYVYVPTLLDVTYTFTFGCRLGPRLLYCPHVTIWFLRLLDVYPVVGYVARSPRLRGCYIWITLIYFGYVLIYILVGPGCYGYGYYGYSTHVPFGYVVTFTFPVAGVGCWFTLLLLPFTLFDLHVVPTRVYSCYVTLDLICYGTFGSRWFCCGLRLHAFGYVPVTDSRLHTLRILRTRLFWIWFTFTTHTLHGCWFTDWFTLLLLVTVTLRFTLRSRYGLRWWLRYVVAFPLRYVAVGLHVRSLHTRYGWLQIPVGWFPHGWLLIYGYVVTFTLPWKFTTYVVTLLRLFDLLRLRLRLRYVWLRFILPHTFYGYTRLRLQFTTFPLFVAVTVWTHVYTLFIYGCGWTFTGCLLVVYITLRLRLRILHTHFTTFHHVCYLRWFYTVGSLLRWLRLPGLRFTGWLPVATLRLRLRSDFRLLICWLRYVPVVTVYTLPVRLRLRLRFTFGYWLPGCYVYTFTFRFGDSFHTLYVAYGCCCWFAVTVPVRWLRSVTFTFPVVPRYVTFTFARLLLRYVYDFTRLRSTFTLLRWLRWLRLHTFTLRCLLRCSLLLRYGVTLRCAVYVPVEFVVVDLIRFTTFTGWLLVTFAVTFTIYYVYIYTFTVGYTVDFTFTDFIFVDSRWPVVVDLRSPRSHGCLTFWVTLVTLPHILRCGCYGYVYGCGCLVVTFDFRLVVTLLPVAGLRWLLFGYILVCWWFTLPGLRLLLRFPLRLHVCVYDFTVAVVVVPVDLRFVYDLRCWLRLRWFPFYICCLRYRFTFTFVVGARFALLVTLLPFVTLRWLLRLVDVRLLRCYVYYVVVTFGGRFDFVRCCLDVTLRFGTFTFVYGTTFPTILHDSRCCWSYDLLLRLPVDWLPSPRFTVPELLVDLRYGRCLILITLTFVRLFYVLRWLLIPVYVVVVDSPRLLRCYVVTLFTVPGLRTVTHGLRCCWLPRWFGRLRTRLPVVVIWFVIDVVERLFVDLHCCCYRFGPIWYVTFVVVVTLLLLLFVVVVTICCCWLLVLIPLLLLLLRYDLLLLLLLLICCCCCWLLLFVVVDLALIDFTFTFTFAVTDVTIWCCCGVVVVVDDTALLTVFPRWTLLVNC